MTKKAQGGGVIGGLFFAVGAILGTWGYSTGNKKLMYVGIGLCLLGVAAMKFVRV